MPKQAGGQVDAQRVAQLEMENQKLRRRLADGDDYDFAQEKTMKLRREISEIEAEKRELQQKNNKLEAQKSRLESIFKSTMKGGSADLIDEVQMLIRRIEFLEEQSDKRTKSAFLESQEPYLREIEMLKSKLV